MRRLLPALALATLLLAPSLAFADVPPTGGCNRCSVEGEGEAGGVASLALVVLVGGLAGLSLRKREDA